jgi:hypothetical protein
MIIFRHSLTIYAQEVNPSLTEAADVEKTVAVGCSLVRAALGEQAFQEAKKRIN